jgi:hypothetical protein
MSAKKKKQNLYCCLEDESMDTDVEIRNDNIQLDMSETKEEFKL